MFKFKSLIALSLLATSALAEKVQSIKIQGNSRIEKASIKNYLKINVGDNVTDKRQNKAIQDLYATSFFERVSINLDKGVLTVKVQEYPIISDVVIEGNVKISTHALKKEILTNFGTTLSDFVIHSDILKIKEIYKKQGGFLTKVEHKVERLPHDRAKVTFKITEGPKVEVRKIGFVGNHHFTNSSLKSKLVTKEKMWLKFWVQNSYSPEKIEHDQMMLQAFYNAQGFADFHVVSVNTQISKNKDYFDIIYVIEEGNKYSLGDIDITNNIKEINTDELKSLIQVKKGDTYNAEELDELARVISNYIENKGYPEVSVSAQTISKDPKKSIINISFVIEKAYKAYIDKINIRGNTKTRDKVIRREFKISEGDIFNRDQIEQSKRNLINLDYFEAEKLKMYTTPSGKTNKYNLEVEVEEKSTSGINLHTGYNTGSGFQAGIGYNERNFLGMGKTLDAGITGGSRYKHYSLGLTEPHFLDRNMSLGVSGSIHTSKTDKKKKFAAYRPYDLTTYGLRVDLGYSLFEDLYHNVYYSYKFDNISINKNTQASKYVQEQAGKTVTSAIGHSLFYDKTDNRIFPRNGYSISGTQEYAGLGGNNRYLKHEFDAKYFKSFFKDYYRIKIAASAGMINGVGGKKVRIQDRFNLGDSSFRGFAFAGIGPRDNTGDKEALGGQKYYVLTAELNSPLGLPKELNLTGNIFVDYGALWSFDLKPGSSYSKSDVSDSKRPHLSVGCGILWITRLAPIRIDIAKALVKRKYDEKQNWHLIFSTNL